MQQKRNLFEELKFQLKSGTMTNKLVIVNICVFLLIHLLFALEKIIGVSFISSLIQKTFTLDATLIGALSMPWGFITSIFAHFDLMHIFSNLIFLYFAGNLFERYFNSRMLLLTYLFGGLAGGLGEVISTTLLFPNEYHTVLGASGSVMAIFAALAFYSPNTKVFLFGVLPVRLFVLALFFLANDLIGIGNANDHIAHFAHLGGALFGFLAMQNLNSSKNILTKIDELSKRIRETFKRIGKAKPKKRRTKSDEEYNYEKKNKQDQTDLILDKISKSGYDSLSKKEKDFLFNQSKNG
jgi:membrane associated rhomboid family serine protease